MKTTSTDIVCSIGQLSFIQIQGGRFVMLPMVFDSEMLMIYAISMMSGAMFFYVATREPRL
jgi:hypothetical protein